MSDLAALAAHLSGGRFGACCECGAMLTVEVEGDPLRVWADIERGFWALHQGPGHGSTDVDTARRARRQQTLILHRERGW